MTAPARYPDYDPEEIARHVVNHAYEKHVVNEGRFEELGIKTPDQFAQHVTDTMRDSSTSVLQGMNGRDIYYNGETNTIVIANTQALDRSTCYTIDPDEFERLKENDASNCKVQGLEPGQLLPQGGYEALRQAAIAQEATRMEAARQQHAQLAQAFASQAAQRAQTTRELMAAAGSDPAAQQAVGAAAVAADREAGAGFVAGSTSIDAALVSDVRNFQSLQSADAQKLDVAGAAARQATDAGLPINPTPPPLATQAQATNDQLVTKPNVIPDVVQTGAPDKLEEARRAAQAVDDPEKHPPTNENMARFVEERQSHEKLEAMLRVANGGKAELTNEQKEMQMQERMQAYLSMQKEQSM